MVVIRPGEYAYLDVYGEAVVRPVEVELPAVEEVGDEEPDEDAIRSR